MRQNINVPGYVGRPGAGTPKEVALLWEDERLNVGVISWTGVYWAVELWGQGEAPPDIERVRRKASNTDVSRLDYLGDCPCFAALERWWNRRVLVSRSDAQAAFLSRLGLHVATDFPKPLATKAISALKQADAAIKGVAGWNFDPDLAVVEPLLSELRANDWSQDLPRLASLLNQLADGAFRSASRLTEKGEEPLNVVH